MTWCNSGNKDIGTYDWCVMFESRFSYLKMAKLDSLLGEIIRTMAQRQYSPKLKVYMWTVPILIVCTSCMHHIFIFSTVFCFRLFSFFLFACYWNGMSDMIQRSVCFCFINIFECKQLLNTTNAIKIMDGWIDGWMNSQSTHFPQGSSPPPPTPKWTDGWLLNRLMYFGETVKTSCCLFCWRRSQFILSEHVAPLQLQTLTCVCMRSSSGKWPHCVLFFFFS